MVAFFCKSGSTFPESSHRLLAHFLLSFATFVALCGFNALVRITLDRLVEHFHERLPLNKILSRNESDLVVQQFLECLECQVLLGHLLDLSKEAFREN